MYFLLFILLLILLLFLFLTTRLRVMSRKSNNIEEHTKSSVASFKVTDHNGNSMIDVTGTDKEIMDKLPDEINEKTSHGDVKITGTSTKKTTTYRNGEKISVEETNSSNTIEKKAIKKCPNCGASIDNDVDNCIYCGTRIN